MIESKKFVNRKTELKFLESRYGSGKAELIVMYGRRRVGKTFLLRHFIDGKDAVYLLAQDSETILDDFSVQLARRFDDRVVGASPLSSWNAFFEYIAARAESGRLVVIIDEVQYIAGRHRPFMSVLQTQWDERLAKTGLMLVLNGSVVSFMEGILAGRSPIYGRRTGAWKVEPLRFRDVLGFHRMSAREAVEAYAVLGGIPQYWSDYDPGRGIVDNIRAMMLEKGARYFDEPKYLLREEMREVARYFAILHAMAEGATSFGEIAARARIDTNSVGKYLNVLKECGYVELVIPALGKRGVYRISDNLFRFWFTFVYPKMDILEMGGDIGPQIRDGMARYVGRAFEDIAKQFLVGLNREGRLPFEFRHIGGWWRGGEEIDLVALGKDSGLFVEVKWSDLDGRDVKRILSDLARKAECFKVKNKYYAVVARKAPKGELVFDLDDIAGK